MRLLAVWALTLLLAGAAPAAGAEDFPITFGGPFELIDHTGKTRTDRDFRGRFMLVYFGYTTCPSICPLDLQILADAVDGLGEQAAKVQPIFVTVDPKRDTVARLADYVPRFHPRLIGLTGSGARIRPVLKAYRVARMKVPQPDGPDAYLVVHGPLTYLMGPDGQFLTFFRHDGGAKFMSRTIRKYLSSEKYRGD